MAMAGGTAGDDVAGGNQDRKGEDGKDVRRGHVGKVGIPIQTELGVIRFRC